MLCGLVWKFYPTSFVKKNKLPDKCMRICNGVNTFNKSREYIKNVLRTFTMITIK